MNKTIFNTKKHNLSINILAVCTLIISTQVMASEHFISQQDKINTLLQHPDSFVRKGTLIEVVVKYRDTGVVELIQVEESLLPSVLADPRYEYAEPDINIRVPVPDNQNGYIVPESNLIDSADSSDSADSVYTNDIEDPWRTLQSYFFAQQDTNRYTMEFFPAKQQAANNLSVRVGIIDDSFYQTDDLVYAEGANFHDGDGDVRGPDFMASQQEIDDCISMHGPAVAQMVLGISDNGIEGAAALDNVELVAAKAMRCGSGSLFAASLAIRWMAGVNVGYGIDMISQPVHVMNLSLGGEIGSCPSYLQNAINDAHEAGILVVASAGNNNSGVTESGFAPAVCDNVLVVGSVDLSGNKSSFSNFDNKIDIMAIGEYIVGPKKTYPTTGGYQGWNGTSMSSPMVTAAYGLLKQTFPDITPEEGLTYMQLSSTPIANTSSNSSKICDAGECGAGILNANKMMSLAHLANSVGAIRFDNVLDKFTPCDQAVLVANSPDPIAICATFEVTMDNTQDTPKALVSVAKGGDINQGGIEIRSTAASIKVGNIDIASFDYGVRFCADEDCISGLVLPINTSTSSIPTACTQ